MATILKLNAFVGPSIEDTKEVVIVVENILFVEPGYSNLSLVHFSGADSNYILMAYTVADFYTAIGGV